MNNPNLKLPIDFMKYKAVYFGLSLIAIIPGLISLTLYGLKLSIDFTGGSLMELQFPFSSLSENQVTASASGLIDIASIQNTQTGGFVIRAKPSTTIQYEQFKHNLASLSAHLSTSPSANLSGIVDELRYEAVGPTLGNELIRKTIISIILAASIILIYIAYRFSEFKYGVTAVLAMFHDTLILLGIFSLLGHFYQVEVDTLFVTALLTTLSFSVHDTIVVYDRIRESLKRTSKLSFTQVVNRSIAETLVRSINNSMTIIFMLLALWLLGGETTKWFVFALLIGTIAGTYSSTFTAAPLLVIWDNLTNRKQRSN